MRTEARAEAPAKMMPKKVMEVRIKRAENGGHTVEHHFGGDMGGNYAYREPTMHAFGDNQGAEMLSHVANKMGVKMSGAGQEHSEVVPANEEEEDA